MSPYEHFFWNYAIFFRKPWAWKVGIGGVLPDLVYMVAFFPRVFFYHSFMDWMRDPLWDTLWSSSIARSFHSLVIWGGCLLLMLMILKREPFRNIFPFFIGWGLHILFDAFTHVSDGYALFYPLTDYRFPAPISYWEKAHHAGAYFWISHSLMAGLILLWIGWKLRQHVIRKRPGTSTVS